MAEAAAIHHRMTPGEWMALVALSVLWGGAFFFTGVAVRELPPLTIVTSRAILAALALGLIVHATGRRLARGWAVWSAFAIMGLLSVVVPFCLITWG